MGRIGLMGVTMSTDSVIPAKAGIQFLNSIDSRLRGSDGLIEV